MNHKIFHVENYLVAIEKDTSVGDMTRIETWDWEITLATHDEIHQGKAICAVKKREIHWRELETDNPLDEMIKACKYHMEKH